MSQLQVDTILNTNGDGAPDFPNGMTVTGVVTATTLNQNVTGIITATSLSLSGDITGVDNLSLSGGINATGVITATSFSGDGGSLTGVAAAASGVAHGSIGVGTAVVVRSDGKFTAATGTNVVRGTTADTGFQAVAYPSITYDTANGKVIVVWQGYSDDDGFAVVGTISGTTISWGSTVKWNGTTNSRPNTVCYDSTNERIVIVFREDNGHIRSCVGQVSGTSITFGSIVTIDSNSGNNSPDCAFDSTTGKVIAAWRRHTNDYGAAKVGTVSGTSISWGSEVLWTGTQIDKTSLACHGGYVVCVDQNKVNVGQISGTSITFGTMATIPNFATSDATNIAVDPNTGIFLIQAQRDATSLVSAIPATRSGTTLTFGTYKSLTTSSPSNNQTLCWAGGENKFFSSFSSGSNANDGMQSVDIQVNATGTSLSVSSPYVFLANNSANDQKDTADCAHAGGGKVVVFLSNMANNPQRNGFYYVEQTRVSNASVGSFVGLSNAAYTDGQTAKVSVTGSVSTNQSGLIAGSRYFLIADGSISPEADSGGVIVGDALSATNILLR